MDMTTKIILFPFVFSITWIFILGLISAIGGWSGISKKHPYNNSKYKDGRLYKFQSIKLSNFGRYSFCIHLTIFENGILLNPSLFFKFFHNPIFIEYKQFLNPKFMKFLFLNFLIFQLGDRTIRISGNSIKELRNKFNIS